jgi:Zn-dependent peptidase ImmA (M78 family)/DNA-binding XRE family transcriptional regulator
MNIGERVKGARERSGISLRTLAEQAGVSAQAISKYERGLDMPGSAVLIRLAKALDVKVEFLLRSSQVILSTPEFRRKASFGVRDQRRILAQVQDWLERRLSAESIVGESVEFSLPDINRRVEKMEDAERVADDLRRAWELGFDTMDNLSEVMEAHGIKVGLVDGEKDFDALTVYANSNIPVVVLKSALSGDRQRMNLSHELGHLILDVAPGVDKEKAAFRFAGAFLAPARAVRAELGNRRSSLDDYELHLLKHKYGISMQALIFRARDLGIISESTSIQLFKNFRIQGWHIQEPGDSIPPEIPLRLDRLVMRAQSENLISDTRAAELLGMPLKQFWRKVGEQHAGFPADVYP